METESIQQLRLPGIPDVEPRPETHPFRYLYNHVCKDGSVIIETETIAIIVWKDVTEAPLFKDPLVTVTIRSNPDNEYLEQYLITPEGVELWFTRQAPSIAGITSFPIRALSEERKIGLQLGQADTVACFIRDAIGSNIVH